MKTTNLINDVHAYKDESGYYQIFGVLYKDNIEDDFIYEVNYFCIENIIDHNYKGRKGFKTLGELKKEIVNG